MTGEVGIMTGTERSWTPDKVVRRRSKLERRLAAAEARVVKHTAKLADVAAGRGRKTAERVASRMKKLRRADEDRSVIEARLARLIAARSSTRRAGTAIGEAGAGAARTGPEAYCLRERARRAMRDPVRTQLRDGRRALRGACSSCGATLVRYGT
jgi:hypothetical protein